MIQAWEILVLRLAFVGVLNAPSAYILGRQRSSSLPKSEEEWQSGLLSFNVFIIRLFRVFGMSLSPGDDVQLPPSSNRERPERVKVLACQRCRVRKQKCDNLHPTCSQCLRAKTACVPMQRSRTRGSQHPNGNVEALEQRMATMEAELEKYRAGNNNHSPHAGGDEMTDEHRPLDTGSVTSNTSRWSGSRQLVSAELQPRPTQPSFEKDSQGALNGTVIGSGFLPASMISQFSQSIHNPTRDFENQTKDLDEELLRLLPNDAGNSLVDAYFKYVHPQHPFLGKARTVSLCRDWILNSSLRSSSTNPQHALDGCIVYMIFSIGALICDGSTFLTSSHSDIFFRHVTTKLLPGLLSRETLLNQTVIFLLLAMRALHASSSSAIVHLSSVAIRTAISGGLHRRNVSIAAFDTEYSLQEQTRKRIWWCCYGLDRNVAMVFGHPVAIADDFITVEIFANVSDDSLVDEAGEINIENSTGPEDKNVSIAYHLTFARKIQSRIITAFSTSMSDIPQQPDVGKLRSQFSHELEEWQASIPAPEDKAGYGGLNWFRMIAYYSVIGLVSGLKDDIRQGIGAKAIVACCNACITFRDIQRSRQIAQSWLAVLSQFQAGVTILYCFWATPPKMRTIEFNSSYSARGVRTCSNNLVLLAEKWTEAEVYRDAFEHLAKVVSVTSDLPDNENRRLAPHDTATLENFIYELQKLGAHFKVIQMLEEICREERPVWQDKTPDNVATYSASSTVQSQPQLLQNVHGVQGLDDQQMAGLTDHGTGNVLGMPGGVVGPMTRNPGLLGLGDYWNDIPWNFD